MAAKMLLTLILPLLMIYPTVSTPLVDYNLKSVHVVFRHGDSTLLTPEFHPYDPENPHEFNPRQLSDLTNAGKMRSYKLGQYLRSRYSDFLGEEYQSGDVYARSTYLERARASLLLVLAGLYPPEAKQRWHPSLAWQPIAIESPESGSNDPLMWPIDCSTYLEERNKVESSPGFMASIASLIDFFVQLSNVTSLEPELTEAVLHDLYNKLRTGIDAAVSIPDWTDVFISSKITRNAAVLRYHTQNYNDRLRRLNGGFLLKKIVDDMTSIIKGETKPKINLYGGQEFNVVALLWALDVWRPMVPTYSTAVIVEHYEKDSKHYVKVLYHEGLTGETEARIIDGCTLMCPLEQLVKSRQNVMPLDMSECYNEYDNRKACYKHEKERQENQQDDQDQQDEHEQQDEEDDESDLVMSNSNSLRQ